MTDTTSQSLSEADARKTVRRWMEMIDYAYQCRDDIRSSSGATPRSGELRLLAEEMLATLTAHPPAAQDREPMTDEQIEKIGETLGEQVPGVSDYTSWPGLGYRPDESGEYKVPVVPQLAIEFARAIERFHGIKEPQR